MRRFLCAAGLVLITASGFSQKKSVLADRALFSVDDQNTYTSEFLYLYHKNNQAKGDVKEDSKTKEKKIREYLDLVVNFKLKVAEAHLRGVDTTQTFVKEFTTYRDELKKPYVASADELGRLVKEAYERSKEEVQAAHILINVAPDASPKDTLAAWQKIVAIRDRVLAGEDFAILAGELSDDPTAKQNGGMLGYFSALQMVYKFEDAAFKTKTGELSQPVRTRFGYHIIKVYDRRPASGQVEVSHILFNGTDQKSRNKAFEASEQLKGGRSWNDVVAEFSADTNSKDRGGKLPPIGVGDLPAVPEFEQVAFSLKTPGEITEPFPSKVGWHIIKLERKIPVATFEESEAALKRRVGRDERLQISQSATLNKRKAEFGFIENPSVKAKLDAKDSTLQPSDVLFTLDKKTVSVGEFRKFKGTYEQFVDTKLNDAEDAKLQVSNADYRNLVREYKEGIMFFSIMETEVWNKGSADTVGQRAYYEAHKNKYQGGDRVLAHMYASTDKAFLTEVQEKAAKGDTLSSADLKKFKSVTNSRTFGKGENKIVDMVPWAVGLHEAEADGMYYLVEIERLVPPGLKSLQEARASVISDYQEEIEKLWIQALKAKHTVKVDKKAVKAVVQQLVKE